MTKKEHWQKAPDPHDFPAAKTYLSLLLPAADIEFIVRKLKTTSTSTYKAKDLLRASRLPLLPKDDSEVVRDLAKIKQKTLLSPVLLVRGNLAHQVPLTVADGYHRICTSYHLNEDADIPCRLVTGPKR